MPVIRVFAMRSKRISNSRTFPASYRLWGATGDPVSKQEQQNIKQTHKRLFCFAGYARNRAQDFTRHGWLLFHYWATVTDKYNGHFILKLSQPELWFCLCKCFQTLSVCLAAPDCSDFREEPFVSVYWLFRLWKCRKILALIDPSKTV